MYQYIHSKLELITNIHYKHTIKEVIKQEQEFQFQSLLTNKLIHINKAMCRLYTSHSTVVCKPYKRLSVYYKY